MISSLFVIVEKSVYLPSQGLARPSTGKYFFISKEITDIRPIIYDQDDELINSRMGMPTIGTFVISKEITTTVAPTRLSSFCTPLFLVTCVLNARSSAVPKWCMGRVIRISVRCISLRGRLKRHAISKDLLVSLN